MKKEKKKKIKDGDNNNPINKEDTFASERKEPENLVWGMNGNYDIIVVSPLLQPGRSVVPGDSSRGQDTVLKGGDCNYAKGDFLCQWQENKDYIIK